MIADRIRSIQAVSGGGGGGGFDPTTYTGLLRWYSASDVVLSGSNITQFNDKSGNGNHATQATSTKQPLISYLPSGTVASFDGVDDIVNFAAMTLTGDFTVYWAGWMREAGGASAAFFGESEASPNSLNTFNQGTYWYNNNGDIIQGNNGRIAPDNFYTVTATRTGTTVKCEIGSFDNSTQPANSNPTIGQIGRAYRDYSKHDLGEFLVYNQYHDAATRQTFRDWIYSNYNMDSLLLNMQGTAGTATFVDESPNNFTVTRNGDTVLVSDATFGTVASFDGAGDYLQTDAASCFAGTQDFTVEFWLYWDAVPTADTAIVGALSSGGSSIGIFNYGNSLGILKTGGGTFANFGSKSQLTAGQWNHVAVTRSGSSHRCFINGMLSSSGVVTLSADWGTPTTCWIGRQGHATIHNYLAGKIGPTRITKGVARYTSNFTPPTGLFPTS